jgi:N-formylglutamate amidohydrolase
LVQSAKTRGGLGLIPSRIAGSGSIWRQRTPQDEVRRRVEQVHRPYHETVAQLLVAARDRFGVAILLDCHSMPPKAGNGGENQIVFGDRHGSSISPDYLSAAVDAARLAGFSTGCNVPYAGGHITSRHGKPTEGIHALQLEIDRSAYLAPDLRSPGEGFDRVAQMILHIVQALSDRAIGNSQALAAE